MLTHSGCNKRVNAFIFLSAHVFTVFTVKKTLSWKKLEYAFDAFIPPAKQDNRYFEA